MPQTRSTTAAGAEAQRDIDNDGQDAHNSTIRATSTLSLEEQLTEMMDQIKRLTEEVSKRGDAPTTSNTPAVEGNAGDSGAPLAAALSELSRTLSSGRSEHGRKLYDLPEFDGRPEDWPMFREAFEMTTDEYQYNNRQNLMRLQKALKGRAKESVECLLIHSDNVDQVINTLKTQFGRPELLVKSQIIRIRNVSAIPDSRIEQLLPFATKVQNLASFLKAAKCEHHLSDPTLMEELVLKLSVQRRLEWAKYSINIQTTPTIQDFSNWLQELAQVVSLACTDLNRPTQVGDNRHTRRTQFFLANEVNDKDDGICMVCSEPHDITDCKRFYEMNHGQRWRCARQHRLCFNCLGCGHRTDSCMQRHECSIDGCNRKLHRLLHPAQDGNWNRRNVHEPQEQVFTNLAPAIANTKVLFKILPVQLFANGRVITSYAFIDEGSAVSLMNKSLADRLGLKGPEETLTMQWFGNKTVTERSTRVDIKISGSGRSSRKFDLKNVRTVRDLRLPTQSLNISQLHIRHRYMKKLPVREYKAATPELLIGLDNAHLGVPRRVMVDGWKCPAVILTKLGWVVYGAEGSASSTGLGIQRAHFAQVKNSEVVEHLVRSYIANENLGVRETDREAHPQTIVRAKHLLENTTIRIGTGFETGLLWKHDNIFLPASRHMAEKRLFALEKKFSYNEVFRNQYTQIMKEYLEKGYSRKLTTTEAANRGERTWYLPHFGVVNPNKPNKLRLVFDAAAEVGGVSLNSVLLTGPDQCQPLTMILMKFRQRPIGVCADIVEMFHQVKIRQEDQTAQRFLWRTDAKRPIEEYVMTSMTFGATCSPCSAQFVKNHNAEEFRAQFPEAVDAIVNNHYVDDFAHSFSSEQEAIRVTERVIWIHKQGGFELKRFVSNSKEVSQKFREPESEPSILNLDKGDVGHYQKVLGLHWDTDRDTLKFVLAFGKIDPELLQGIRRPTKRELLSIAMSVFDPFGFAAEYSLMAKLALQSVWREVVGWDEQIPDEANAIWLKWFSKLREVGNIRVPRCYSTTFTSKPIELHVFADASEQAYAVVAYWRIPDEYDVAQLAFVAGKTKCAPLKLTTIPRLELQSAVLATRLRDLVLRYHDITTARVVMWSDSKTVLSWICSDHRRYKPYVAHRVNEILESSRVHEWRWLPSALNPADFGTRAMDSKRESFWLSGPAFLKLHESKWPQAERHQSTNEEIRVKTPFFLISVSDIFERFSNFSRLKRVVGWLFRFYVNCSKTPCNREYGGLKTKELETAEMTICRRVQMMEFADEYQTLREGNQLKGASCLWRLSPYMDESGVIRIKGRIDAAYAVPDFTRRPIIMPKNHHVTMLIVDYYHRTWSHQNEETIIAEIRRRYWIPHIRTVVRAVAKRCVICKREKAKPVNPTMGQLPEDRLTPFVRPFSYVGVDYMGPFSVVRGRSTEKRWIALFTCLTTRAVHLEIARDLTTDTCLMCIRNFMNRRGTPVRIRSDNGTNFIGADRELKRQLQQLDHRAIADTLANTKIEWVFNCPLNPHAGGCWERLVRSVKRAMGHAIYNERLQEHSLYSLMCEAENIINSRPLTHIPLDSPADEPLTPNHFLLGTPNSEQTPHPLKEELGVTRKQWRKVQQMQHRFWNKWLSEYLPDLCRRTKWYQPTKPLATDDVVLVCDTKIHRSKWPVGRIIRVFPGKDSQVRTAEVRTRLGTFKRPACILAKLDIGESEMS